MTAPLVSISRLSAVSLREGGSPILRDVSLTLERGEVRGLVGESGAGKSTIAKALLGILPRTVKVTSGRIDFEGRDLLTMPERQLRAIMGSEIALIPQDPQTALNPGRRIEAQLTDGLRLRRGMDARAARERALRLLDEVHIRDPERVLRAYPHELSGGMRQRVMIASAFSLEPKLVVADEPTTALDVTVQKQILRLIRGMQEAHGTGVIFVTHDLGVVAKICDSVTLLYGGKVIEAGPTASVLSAPRHAYTRALIAAGPRYDRPDAGLEPVPQAVFDQLKAELSEPFSSEMNHVQPVA
jgi:peptide/nickel transport system ATP-binding protein